jgi:hypothetical protein
VWGEWNAGLEWPGLPGLAASRKSCVGLAKADSNFSDVVSPPRAIGMGLGSAARYSLAMFR